MTTGSSINTFLVGQIRFEDMLWEKAADRSPRQESSRNARFPCDYFLILF